jgi:uncharacterized protein YrrD
VPYLCRAASGTAQPTSDAPNVTRLVRATELMGLPVVASDTSEVSGEIRDVLFDPARSRVVAFTVRGQGLLSPPLIGLAPMSAVHSIDEGAVLIPTDASMVRERAGMAAALNNQVEVLGREVVNDQGETLGIVIDVVLEVEGREAIVVGWEIDQGDEQTIILPLALGTPLSEEALIVPAATEPYAANGLAGFREALARARTAQAPTP